ncbi:hypothetical protein MCUN1_000313 [Malassezia cuniculi]|uniref:N-alpha-acetyltransferase 16, NatA auxiliary subunit n=1 Tax=Malassezia cuniculi TaxID=948313 RepID=A0AAF0ER42_9BASI|nr:hypothetical protein MCUN1_000313 [Malassezia cuniculi]
MPPKRAAPLPAKERALFARLLNEYETKKHRLALKTADAILKRVPEHGETLAIKGLVLFTMHERAEGLRLAKLGVRYDLGSFICWHALGIVYRMDRNFAESLKCYGQALRIEGGNLNILRETGFLQLQLRNYAPLIDVRLAILRVQPHIRANWIALAVAHALAGNNDQAVRVLAAYEDVNRDIPPRNYEFSEVILFHAALLVSSSRGQEALDLLAAQAARIVDAPAADALRARAYAQTGDASAAKAAWRALVERNPENADYVEAYLGDGPLSDLEALQQEFPKSATIRRIALERTSGDDFKRHAAAYLERALVRNIPSLFSQVKALYKDEEKKKAFEEIAERLRAEWAPPAGITPTSYLWTLYFLAHHYSATGNGERALAYIDSAIAHTPTLPELHMTRARILKRLGAIEAAADAMDDARLLDGQDRYLNTKAAKYALRTGDVARATATVKLFTRPEVEDPLADLVEMQAVKYLLEDGEAHAKAGETALALKRFVQIVDIAQEIYDDQLDFHSYCMRKMTLRAYLSSVHFEDRIKSRRECVIAARRAIDIYVELYDKKVAPPNVEETTATTGATTSPAEPVDAAEARKAAQKARKAEARKAEAQGAPAAAAGAAAGAAATASATNASTTSASASASAAAANSDEPPAPQDPDPKGETLVATETPLEDAHRYVRLLQEEAPEQIETWLAVYEVAVREKRWNLLLRALAIASTINAADPRVHVLVLRAQRALEGAGVSVDAIADTVPLAAPAAALQTEFVQRHSGAADLLGAARGALVVDADAVAEAAALLERLPACGSLAEVEEGLRLLQSIGADTTTYTGAAVERFPRADAFAARESLQDAAAARKAARDKWIGDRSHV